MEEADSDKALYETEYPELTKCLRSFDQCKETEDIDDCVIETQVCLAFTQDR